MADSEYTYETDVTVRFRDLDAMNQVHNGVVLSYAEEGRARYFRDVLDVSLPETNGAIARQEVDYHGAITYDSAVIVRYRVVSVGETSVSMAFEVEADGEAAARGEAVHVVLDETDTPRPVPEEWRDRIRDFEDGAVDVA